MPIRYSENLITGKADQSKSIIPVSKQTLASHKKTLGKSHKTWVEEAGFEGDEGHVLALPDKSGNLASILWGIGDLKVHEIGSWHVAQLVENLPPGTYNIETRASADTWHRMQLGWRLAHYAFDTYKEINVPERRLVLPQGQSAQEASILANAMAFTRDLVNTPSEDMLPHHLADIAHTLANKHEASLSVTKGQALNEKGFPTLYAVGRAANAEPHLIDLRWSGKKGAPTLALVGKGICFDSGGLNIKTASGMRIMKKDMGGAAVVLGLSKAIMEAKLPVNLHVLVPTAENAIAGNAYRPGDILKTRAGISVEITNTDAEGRLALCDALTFADEHKPDAILDIATLTGAARVALGPDLPAFYAGSQSLADAFTVAATRAQDPVWQMPLYQGYNTMLDSPVADCLNCSESPFAGSVTAALFLQKFIKNTKAWGHLDAYCWNQTQRAGRPTGGEASALRAIFEWVKTDFAKTKRAK